MSLAGWGFQAGKGFFLARVGFCRHYKAVFFFLREKSSTMREKKWFSVHENAKFYVKKILRVTREKPELPVKISKKCHT